VATFAINVENDPSLITLLESFNVQFGDSEGDNPSR
jgi:hypothetical protein